MYRYRPVDQQLVDERVTQFRDQVRRRVAGELSEEQFLPLRLQNGLYYQRHAYMLRVAIPYGTLSSAQLRMLAHIARTYDRGYGHITTRQNLQYNWLELERVPDLLADLASVEMHAIQTSGNCVRNVTADHLAGVADDELFDPRPFCELLRQYSTFHPEFLCLPRKFKVAFTGAAHDRAAVLTHDLAFRATSNADGELGFAVIAGGGLGRTPILASVVREFLPLRHLLTYTEAVLRVYNLHGNRDVSFKARIKILVRTLGVEAFTRQVEEEWARIKARGRLILGDGEIERVSAFFELPRLNLLAAADQSHAERAAADGRFRSWLQHNVEPHKAPGYNIVHILPKSHERAPGDLTAEEMELLADLAERFSFDELRMTHAQNAVLPHVENAHLHEVWAALDQVGLAEPIRDTIHDLICCPGMDYCSLANAASIPVAKEIHERFADLDRVHDIGELQLKMSGCINACAHHHVGHIGVLGVDKKGEHYYQIMLGGSAANDASLGTWLGKALARDKIVDALEDLLHVYLQERLPGERFIDAYRRIGVGPFSAYVYRHHETKPKRGSAEKVAS